MDMKHGVVVFPRHDLVSCSTETDLSFHKQVLDSRRPHQIADGPEEVLCNVEAAHAQRSLENLSGFFSAGPRQFHRWPGRKWWWWTPDPAFLLLSCSTLVTSLPHLGLWEAQGRTDHTQLKLQVSLVWADAEKHSISELPYCSANLPWDASRRADRCSIGYLADLQDRSDMQAYGVWHQHPQGSDFSVDPLDWDHLFGCKIVSQSGMSLHVPSPEGQWRCILLHVVPDVGR